MQWHQFRRLSCTTGSDAVRISSQITTLKKAIFTDWTLKTWNGLLLLDSNSLHRLTWIKTETETWQTCQVISSNIRFLCCSSCLNCWCGQLQQSLELLLLRQGCSNRWDCCYEHRVAAIAGIALIEHKVAAIAGIAVLKRYGRSWILPLITVCSCAEQNSIASVTMMKFYLEAVQDVCWRLHCFCARLVL